MTAYQNQGHDQLFLRLLDKPGGAGTLLRYRQVMVLPEEVR
ncbi:hypothetical protein WCLP8_4130005 [uncultured Gammaproteobacteria bacterium]